MHTFFKRTKEIISVPYLEDKYGIGVFFTSRLGGISSIPFKSLNLSFNVGDEREAVLENRARLSREVGVGFDRWVFCRQVHGCRVRCVDRHDLGRGAYDYESAIPRSDALLTAEKETAVGILTADCVPVVMVAGTNRICAVAHAGWRGVLAGVVPVTCRRMMAESGGSCGEIQVFIGPHIRSCCFTVKDDIAGMFPPEYSCVSVREEQGRLRNINLESILVGQLVNEGLSRNNIHSVGICTSCDDNYFSHRKEKGNTGRQAGIAVIY